MFYGTIAILVTVNIFHFLGSPYLIAKNCLTKINKDYEIIGETLGISKWAIFTKVLIPNSCFSLIEMFSYFFLNSMITISAVVRRIQSREKEEGIELNRYQFEMLTFLEKNGKQRYSNRVLADGLTYSLSTITKLLKELQELNYITINADHDAHQ